MKEIKNKNGIKMSYYIDNDVNKVVILDSNGNYFEDMYYDTYDNDNGREDIMAIVNVLEQTTLDEMCSFYGFKIYKSLQDLAEKEDLTLKEIKDNEYVNEFIVNGTKYYTWANVQGV